MWISALVKPIREQFGEWTTSNINQDSIITDSWKLNLADPQSGGSTLNLGQCLTV